MRLTGSADSRTPRVTLRPSRHLNLKVFLVDLSRRRYRRSSSISISFHRHRYSLVLCPIDSYSFSCGSLHGAPAGNLVPGPVLVYHGTLVHTALHRPNLASVLNDAICSPPSSAVSTVDTTFCPVPNHGRVSSSLRAMVAHVLN